MPTFEALGPFWDDWSALSAQQRKNFMVAVAKLVEDLRAGRGFRPGLRVKGVRGAPGIFELTWADDGRATFQYGSPVREGETHVIWRRIGTHELLRRP